MSFLLLSFYRFASHHKIPKILKLFLGLKNLFIAILDMYLIYYCLGHLLGLDAHHIVFPICIFALCFYICKQGIEVTARLSELIIFLIIVPVIILIITTASSLKIYYLKGVLQTIDLHVFSSSWTFLLLTSFLSSLLFAPVDSYIIVKNHVSISDNHDSFKNNISCIYKAYVVALSISLLICLLLLLIISGSGISFLYSDNPLFSLTQMNSINSSISGRIDGIVCIFLFSGLIYTFCFHIYSATRYMQQITIMKVSTSFITAMIIAISVIVTAFAYDDDIITSTHTDPKTRNLIDTIIIDDEYNISLKSYKDGSIYNTHCKSIKHAADNYFHSLGSYPDFSHTETIIVPSDVFTSREALANLLVDFKMSSNFPETMDVISNDASIDNKSDKTIKLYKIYALL